VSGLLCLQATYGFTGGASCVSVQYWWVAADCFHPEIMASDLAQLALEPQIESARRLVSLLFERNSDYFVGKVVQTHAFTPGSVGARFHALLMRAGPVDYDDRRSAIEVQVN